VEVDRPVQQLRLYHHVLVSPMSDREKRDLNEGKWGVGLKNKILKSSVK